MPSLGPANRRTGAAASRRKQERLRRRVAESRAGGAQTSPMLQSWPRAQPTPRMGVDRAGRRWPARDRRPRMRRRLLLWRALACAALLLTSCVASGCLSEPPVRDDMYEASRVVYAYCVDAPGRPPPSRAKLRAAIESVAELERRRPKAEFRPEDSAEPTTAPELLDGLRSFAESEHCRVAEELIASARRSPGSQMPKGRSPLVSDRLPRTQHVLADYACAYLLERRDREREARLAAIQLRALERAYARDPERLVKTRVILSDAAEPYKSELITVRALAEGHLAEARRQRAGVPKRGAEGRMGAACLTRLIKRLEALVKG